MARGSWRGTERSGGVGTVLFALSNTRERCLEGSVHSSLAQVSIQTFYFPFLLCCTSNICFPHFLALSYFSLYHL